MAKRDIDRLRDLARQRHRAATNKASRLRAKGVEVTGTNLDPRKNAGDIQKMRTRDLNAYINRLDKFVSRETKYEQGAKAVLSGNLFHTYKSLEAAVNRKNLKPYQSIKDQFLDSLGMTVEQFQGTKPTNPQTGNPASRAPHLPVNRSAKQIVDDKALQKLIKDMQKKLTPDHDFKVVQRDQYTALKLLKDTGLTDVMSAIAEMDAKKFSFMWNYTDFARIASQEYFIASSTMHDSKSLAALQGTFDTQVKAMRKIIKDVKRMELN